MNIKCVHLGPYTDYDGSRQEWHCGQLPTWHITGFDIEGPCAPDDDARVDVFTCDEHKDVTREDLAQLVVEPIDEHFRQGFEQGHEEALLAVMSTQTAWTLVVMNAGDDLPSGFDPRTPMTGEWADETEIRDSADVDQYRDGFAYGWRFGLVARATKVLEEQDQDVNVHKSGD